MRADPWWSLAGWSERLSGLPARFALPIIQAAQGALIGTVGLYWDGWRHAGGEDAYWTAPHLLILWGLEAAVISAALIHGALEGPRAAGERPSGRGPKVLLLVEHAINAALVRMLAPGRGIRRGSEATHAPGARLMLVAGAIGVAAFGLQEPIDRLLGVRASVVDVPHLIVIASATAATIGVALLIRDALSLAVPRPLARPWPGVAAGALLVGVCALWVPLDTYDAGSREAARAIFATAAVAGVLVLARTWIGPGGAIQAAAWFILVRLGVAGVVGALPGGEAGHVELPLAEAAAIELAFARGLSPGVAGGLAAAVGVPVAWAWGHVSLGPPLGAGALPVVLAIGIPLAAASAAIGKRTARSAGLDE